ncbi:MAG: UDP-N-acetylmuramate dehydrogenase [Lentisphaerae bacterium]|nr:UDP-N-acetylmuramate dehydrogenase [Lentisphaerota bacterium]
MTDDLNKACHLFSGPCGHVHFVGIGGVGMAALAFQLKQKGFKVSGCDLRADELVTWLEGQGIEIRRGHDPSHLAGAQWVVRTAAVRLDHPEIRSAAARGIPVLPRGAVLAALLQKFFSVIVCGSHGKTTTTAMLARIFAQAGRDPSFCIGGITAQGAAGAGKSNLFVAEADESDGTLAFYQPDIAVVTNLEFDHAEHFADLAELRACFQKMLGQVRRQIVYCRDDAQAAALCRDLAKGISYGLTAGGHSFSSRAREGVDSAGCHGVPARGGSAYGGTAAAIEHGDWHAVAIAEKAASISFQVWHGAKKMGLIKLPAPGRHNALNALAACAVAQVCGIGFDACQAALQTFQPVRRRFERISSSDEVLVISDYAHHPTEIAATLRNLPRLKRQRFFAVFQPHRYSRTRALRTEFAAALKNVDELILAPVYAASESAVMGGTHWDLYEQVRHAGQVRALAASSLEQAWGYLRTALKAGDGLLILGAGDVEKIGNWARAEIAQRGLQELDPAQAWAATLAKMPWEATIFKRSAPLAAKTTLRVGGAADILAQVSNEADLTSLLHWAHDNQVPFTVLGAGSNMLVSDLGARGVVVRLGGQVFRQIYHGNSWLDDRQNNLVCLGGQVFRQIRREAETQVVFGAAVRLKELTGRLAADGLSGLEFLTGIPGTVGGALRMNAGAFGEAIGERVLWIRFLNPDGSAQVAAAAALAFGYRCCPELAGKIVIEAAFQVASSNQAKVRACMAEISKRRSRFDIWPSAGSVFRNPEGDFAGRLLEGCGLKGRRVGGARVAEEHANFIVTERGAMASDVRALMEIMADAVRQKFGVELKKEIVCLE